MLLCQASFSSGHDQSALTYVICGVAIDLHRWLFYSDLMLSNFFTRLIIVYHRSGVTRVAGVEDNQMGWAGAGPHDTDLPPVGVRSYLPGPARIELRLPRWLHLKAYTHRRVGVVGDVAAEFLFVWLSDQLVRCSLVICKPPPHPTPRPPYTCHTRTLD